MSSIRSVLIFLALSLVVFSPAYSQEDNKKLARDLMEIAKSIMQETKAIDQAREQAVSAAEFDTTYLEANWYAGLWHIETINKDDAVKYLMRVYRQDPSYRFDLEYFIGKSFQYGLEFDKAIEFFNLYKDKLAKKPNYQGKDKVSLAHVNKAIFECENGKIYVATPGDYSIVNIGREINSEWEDYAPVLNENEDEIVFTSRRKDDNLNENVDADNKPFEDIFIAKKNGASWSYAKNIGETVNTPYHGSSLALSADGNTLFIYKDENGGDIYYCELQPNGSWGEPMPLPGIINSSFEEKSITISKDEKTLYFASNRPGGMGGATSKNTDIYQATKDKNGEWSNVKNLGPTINTEFDEDGPFIDYDGVTLFFSSKGHKGMGGHDIYRSVYNQETGEWSEPENMGYPINTPDDDIYFVTTKDPQRAYYSSVRDDGLGYTDIYRIIVPEGTKNAQAVAKKTDPVIKKEPDPVIIKDPDPVVTKDPDPVVTRIDPNENLITDNNLQKDPDTKNNPKENLVVEPKKEIKPIRFRVSIIDVESQNPLNAKVRLQGLKDNVLVKSIPSEPGIYEFEIVSNKPKDYRLTVELDGYIFQNQKIKIDAASTEEKTLTRTIELRRLTVGVTSILRNIYFDFDRATFKTDSYPELNKLEAMLRQNSNIIVEIGGHTDGVGSKEYNIFLSRKRAEAVKDYLTKKGIDTRRIKVVGYGKTKPLASNDDENDGRELNRRVEFKVLKN
jgi:outer membrane protein OmpA-like peptidoglycan-associated protein